MEEAIQTRKRIKKIRGELVENPIKITEKYERNGWPALARPDLKPPEGWSLNLITSIEKIRSHKPAPNGEMIAYVKDGESHSDIHLVKTSGGWPGRITTDRPASPFWDDEIPQWSPDGKWLAFGIDEHISIMPSQGGVQRRATDFASAASNPRWMPDSRGLIVTIERHEVDQLVLTDRDGAWPRSITEDAIGDHWFARPTPDGSSVVYVFRHLDDLNRFDICSVDMETGRSKTLYGRASTRATHPRPSPDGKWIGFISQESGHEEIWMVKPDGEGLHQLTKSGQDVQEFEWSPDSRQLAVIFNRDGRYDLSLVEVDTGRCSDLRSTQGVHQNPNWSADGKSISYEFESPLQPTDVFTIEVESKHIKQLTYSMPRQLEWIKRVEPEPIRYKSYDGLEVPALVYRPKEPNGAAIVYLHGGPKDQYIYNWDELAQYFTAKGYTYLAPNFRGSLGYGLDFERANYNDWGHGDTQDCIYGAKFLRSIAGIHPERIGVLGGSYGGYLSVCTMTWDPEFSFACGITMYGDAHLFTSWAQCERRLRLYTEIFLGHPAKNLEKYTQGSPINEVRNIRKPLLILHGLEDTICPPESSEELVEALKRENKTFEYKTYAGEAHGIVKRANQLDIYERIERFFDWYLWPIR